MYAVASGSWGGQRPRLGGYVTVTVTDPRQGARRRRAFMLPILSWTDLSDSPRSTRRIANATVRLLHRNRQRVALLRNVEYQELQRRGLARVLVVVHGPWREATALSRLQVDRFLPDNLEQHRPLEDVGW